MNSYDEETLRKFRTAGKILRETREEIPHFVHENMPIIDVCEKAENLIRQKGAKPAFPCNVSINEVAAHYTSPPNDKTRIPEKSLVKVDIGAHIDGYVTDTAITICLNPEHKTMVDAAERALKTAIENIRADIPISRISQIIETTIKFRGFKPISNLTGHQVGRYLVHAGTSIPNVAQFSLSKLKLGGTYAIEPFTTLPNAIGKVEDGEQTTIFRFVKNKSTANPHAKQLLKYIEENFRTLPFTERWLKGIIPEQHHEEAFQQLLSSKAITGYPIFIEMSGKPVAQAEHTVLVTKDGCEVLT
jgi:methionyl aminopeptidase